jgi:hypothetical protein
MLGYTVETTMKAGLMEVMPEKHWGDRIFISHDVRLIFSKCASFGLFDDVMVSKDFLGHINNNFQRYPRQINKILEQARKSNIVIDNSMDWVYYYDDLVVQLDHHLLRITGNPSISMVYHAIRTLETKYARDILRKNAFALLKFDECATLIRQNMPEREDPKNQIEDNLSKGSTFYWNPDSLVEVAREQIAHVAKIYSASTFQLPKWKIVNGHMEAVIP